MLKRTIIFVFILSAFVLLAMAPMSAGHSGAPQATDQPTSEGGGVTVGVTVVAGTQESVPVTGGNGLPTSTLLIFGLIAVLGVAVIMGGMALLSRRQ